MMENEIVELFLGIVFGVLWVGAIHKTVEYFKAREKRILDEWERKKQRDIEERYGRKRRIK